MTAPILSADTITGLFGLTKTETQSEPVPAFANKYIIFEMPDLEGVERIRLGEATDNHRELLPQGARIISAGFYQQILVHYIPVPALEIRVWGYSESLGITSRPTDAAVIKRYLGR
jgi:hypothetical protein